LDFFSFTQFEFFSEKKHMKRKVMNAIIAVVLYKHISW